MQDRYKQKKLGSFMGKKKSKENLSQWQDSQIERFSIL